MVAFLGSPDIQTVECIKNHARQSFPDHRDLCNRCRTSVSMHIAPSFLIYRSCRDRFRRSFCSNTLAASCDIILYIIFYNLPVSTTFYKVSLHVMSSQYCVADDVPNDRNADVKIHLSFCVPHIVLRLIITIRYLYNIILY